MDPLADLMGESPRMAALRAQVRQIVRSAAVALRPPPLLMLGETGSGKGLLARAIHRAGPRASRSFIDVNCAAIPERLLEAELFGYEKGAFTDARQGKPGLFQLAHRGTLFLDEIGLLAEPLQAKLLTALEQRAVRRLGGTQAEPADVWVLAATNEDLRADVEARRFRQDLYHRLAVITLDLPPLRERGEDILTLAEHFLARACTDYGLPAKTFSRDAREALSAYGWPGNVRELGNVLERVALLSDAAIVDAAALALPGASAPATARPAGPARLRDTVRDHLLAALIDTGWNISHTATRLGLARNTVRARIARFGLEPGGPGRAAAAPARPPRAARRKPVDAAPEPAPAAPRGEARAAAAAGSTRWESRQIGLLRLDLELAGPDSPSDVGRAVDELAAKIQSFGGRIEELGQGMFVAVFGIEPAEDAATRAALAGLAAQRLAEREGARERPLVVRGAVHGAPVSARQVGESMVIDHGDKQAALGVLDRLLAATDTAGTMISAEAAPLLRRRFALLPLGAATPGAPRAYQLSGLERPAFQPAARLSAFVGRAAELGVLEACMARAIDGQGQIVGVTGEPGIGKSRLLHEFRQMLGGEITCYEGQCVSYGAGAPFQPIIDLVRAGCGIAENASAETITHRVHRTLGVLGLDPAEWAPFILHLLGAAESERLAGLSAEAVNARTLEALVQMTLASSRRRPLVVAVEDLHWIDRVSETYLATLAGRIARARILLLVTYRPSEPPSFLDRPDATRIALPPLTPEESASVARSLPGAALDDDAARLIAARAGGNALFVEELALALADGGAESGDAPPAAAEAASRLPATLQGLLASRLDRLGPAKTVAQVAATIAQSFSVGMLEAVFDEDVAILPDALRRLGAAEVIVPDGAASGEYRFRHALIRDAAYQSQTAARRREVHARVGRVLQTDFAEHALQHPELTAHHLTEAGEQQAAIPWWVRAGTRARQRAAYADAIMALQKALDLLSALPPGAERDRTELEIQVSLGISLQATRGFGAPEVGRVHARARELCATVEGGPLVFGALGGLFLYYYFRADLGVAREMAAQHRAVTEATGAINRLCASYSALGFTAHQVGALEEARAHFERSIELSDTYPRPEGTALTPNNIGVASESMLALTLCALGRLDEAGRCAGRALARAERCVPGERAFSTGYAMTCASRVHLLRREPEEARRRAQDAMRIGREHGFALHVGAGLLADCAARIALGEAADEELAAALAAWRGRGLELDAPYWLGAIAEGRRAAGRLDEACAAVDEAIAQMERHGERIHEAELYRLRGELMLERMPAAVGPAADDLERALGVARGQGARLFALRAAMALHRLRTAQGRAAESPLPPLLETFTDHGRDAREARLLLGGSHSVERR